jgi:acyl-ACP thioesterase
MRIDAMPEYGDELELTTFVGAVASRFVERRTTGRCGAEVVFEAAAIWVSVDATGHLAPIAPWVSELLAAGSAPETMTRRISTRLRHPAPPGDAAGRRWPLRVADFDVLGHVNNAVSWSAAEDALATRAPRARVTGAEIEYRAPIDRGEEPELVMAHGDGDDLCCWLTVDGTVRSSAVLGLSR